MRHDPAVPDQPERSVTLHLHAAARAESSGGAVLALRGRAAALVALAVWEPGGIARERAASMLWPDSPNPRQALRQQLLRFRQALGQPLIEGEDTLSAAPGVTLAGAHPHAVPLADEPAGDDDFGRWLAAQRQQRAQAQRAPLLQALAAAEAAAELGLALAHARALVALDAGDESHHAALMRVHYLRGEPAAGLAAYERLSAETARRYGAQPAAATRALAAALRRAGTQAATPPQGASVLPVTLRRPPVHAGRGAEMAAARAGLAEGRVVLFEAEAGMGKSRMLAECLATAPGPVLQAAGRPGDSGAPYSTLARLLLPLLAPLPMGLGAAAAAALARLGGNGSGPAPEALPPGSMQAAVGELLTQAGVATVALDDLHFADAATLELVSGLAAAGASPHWLLAQRPAEGPPAAQALRAGLLELQRLAPVPLLPLEAGAIAALIDSLAVSGLQGATVAPALVRHGGGNPLFVLETLKQGLADGSLARGELPRPASVGALIERRLQRLSEPALMLARVAAIAGVDFRIELAEAATGQRALQLATAWQELQDAQVLRDEAFAHDLVSDAVLRGVPPVVARRVHAECAAWLAGQRGEPARIARHWQLGARPAEAARAFEAAAQRAHDAARQAEEAELYGEAAAAHAAAGDAPSRFEALASRVTALIGAQSDAAALAEARALPEQAASPRQRVRALRVLADLLGQRGPFDEALQVGQDAIALAREAGPPDELARVVALTAGNLCKLGRAQEAYSLMLPLREWAEREAQGNLGTVWHGYWAAVLGHTGRLREGVASYDRAAACAEAGGDRAALSMCLLNQCVVLRTLGALERATEGSRRGLALAPDGDDNANRRLARLMHARNDAETGRFATALQALEALLPQFEAMDTPFWATATRQTQARLWQHLGQHARALQALPADDTTLPGWMQAGTLWLRLEVQEATGRAPTVARLAADGCAEPALALLDGDAFRRTGNAVRGLRFAAAEAVLAAATDWGAEAERHELFGTLAAWHLHRARAALALQRHEVAAQAARALVALLHEGYAPDFAYAPEAWLVATRALRAAGDGAGASASLARGLAWVRQHALPQVPPPFIDSFLHRNPVNRELLALASGG